MMLKLAVFLAFVVGARAAEQTLTSVAEIKVLNPAEAAEHRPVRVRGVITVALGGRRGSFLQDETGGVFLAMKRGATSSLRVGDWIECRGRTQAGQFAPTVEIDACEHLGRKPIPNPVRLSLGEFSVGRHDAEWVETRGIVRTVKPRSGARPELEIAYGRERLRVEISDLRDNMPAHLIDAEVRVTGAAGGFFNLDRQLLLPVLVVPSWDHVVVTRPASGEPFASVLRSSTSLFRYAPDDRWEHLCKLKGVVTHYLAGKVVFVRDDDGALHAETNQSLPLKPGDVVEVVGFPAVGLGAAYLQDAVYRVVGAAPLPAPAAATTALIVQGRIRPSELIAIAGALVESTWLRDRWILTLKSAEHTFDVDLEPPPGGASFSPPERGSQLRVVGVLWTEGIDPRSRNIVPKSFRVLARSPADITVIARTSWWTQARLTRIIATLVIVMTAALIWIWLLRRRVAVQTAMIAEKVAREAVAEERARTACEIHDTVAQGFMALGFQLDALSSELRDSGPPVRRQLDRTMKMLRHSHEEVRHSLKEMRGEAPETRSLSTVLKETVERGVANFTPDHYRYVEHGTAYPLPAAAEHNLLRIAQEAATNAAKHAAARHLEVELRYEPDGVRLRIADDGRGFTVPQPAAAPSSEHFGLQIMRERAQRIGAALDVRSQPGGGTEISVFVPRVGRRPAAAAELLSSVQK